MSVNYSKIIIRPRITEKSGIMSESARIYTFEVSRDASKDSVHRAVKNIYKVEPVKVRIVNLPEKRVFVRGKRGVKPAIKKAMVYLKEGDKIEFI